MPISRYNCRVQSTRSGYKVQRYRVQITGYRVQRYRVQRYRGTTGYRVQRYRAQGTGYRVQRYRVQWYYSVQVTWVQGTRVPIAVIVR